MTAFLLISFRGGNMMKRVVLESPYGSPDPKIVERNVRYARACVRDCLLRGEAAIASHLLYTQPGILRDEIPEERELGIDAGLAWGALGEKSVVYDDFNMSKGMIYGVRNAEEKGRPVEYRKLPPDVLEQVLNPGRDLSLAKRVCKEWKEPFYAFIETGTGDDFVKHLESSCVGCEGAVTRVFYKQTQDLADLGRAIREGLFREKK